jgi:hypothetical protein
MTGCISPCNPFSTLPPSPHPLPFFSSASPQLVATCSTCVLVPAATDCFWLAAPARRARTVLQRPRRLAQQSIAPVLACCCVPLQQHPQTLPLNSPFVSSRSPAVVRAVRCASMDGPPLFLCVPVFPTFNPLLQSVSPGFTYDAILVIIDPPDTARWVWTCTRRAHPAPPNTLP